MNIDLKISGNMRGSVEEKILIIIIFIVVGVYLFFFVKKFEMDTKKAILTIEKNKCILNLSEFDPSIKNINFERFRVQKDVDLNPSNELYDWDVAFLGKKLKGVGFIPERPLYEKMIYAVSGDEFRGCGIHVIGYEDVDVPKSDVYLCDGGMKVYFYQGVYNLYYIDYYRIETNKTTITHFTLSKDMKDIENTFDILRRAKCKLKIE